MDRKYRYSAKNVHDLQVSGLSVRLWSAEGTEGKATISRLFEPIAKTGFVYPYLALMPDWHPGKDSVVGSVIPSRDVLLPSVVGGDIGCGVCAVRLPLVFGDLADSLELLGQRLREVIPVGTAYNSVVSDRVKGHALWRKELRAPVSNRTLRKLVRQFGSLGGGNHFLELQKDLEERLWVMLHSGSRYLGVQVRDCYVERAADQPGIDKRLCARIPYLPADSSLASDYLDDMRLVVEFARASRREMMHRALEAIQEIRRDLDVDQAMAGLSDINHNYVDREEHLGESLFVHRKGAIRVGLGEIGFVPGSMGTSSYVIEGRGNEFAFCSCAHGGGRTMSRAEASRRVTRRDYEQSLQNVVCAHSEVLLDEAPGAYKDIRVVMRGQSDLVKTVFELHPVLSVKGR
jgi:tRNA-splicing ligase RtcB (3'-phosphate/5'-hydroxy nucleic acid ligase)